MLRGGRESDIGMQVGGKKAGKRKENNSKKRGKEETRHL
jgi:hypothetical protein